MRFVCIYEELYVTLQQIIEIEANQQVYEQRDTIHIIPSAWRRRKLGRPSFRSSSASSRQPWLPLALRAAWATARLYSDNDTHLLTKRLAALKRSRCQFSFIPVCISYTHVCLVSKDLYFENFGEYGLSNFENFGDNGQINFEETGKSTIFAHKFGCCMAYHDRTE